MFAKSLLLGILLLQGSAGYETHFRAAEAAKAAGDMARMEAELTSAFRFGDGNEYAWRSLAWAQMRQGKWRESLRSAEENVRRNGETSWSLRQLFESAMAAGDRPLAESALARESRLDPKKRDADLSEDRRRLRAASRPTTYDLSWTLKVADFPRQKGKLVVHVPLRRHLWQTARTWVEGAKSSRTEHIGGRDVMFIDPGDQEQITLRSSVVHRPDLRGPSIYARANHPFRKSMDKALLGPFKNRVEYDPLDPELQKIVAAFPPGNPAEKLQSALDWLAANVKYVDGYPDDLASILKNRKGVCHHQSNLLVAMCRAMGIPSLVAHGVSLSPGPAVLKDVQASHGWVEAYLDGVGWVGVEPLDPNSLRFFRSGYLVVAATGHGPKDDHFTRHLDDGTFVEGIQGLPVNGIAKLD
ncbi:MAG TPA: transglutaminase domain-containing protein [Fimbriimonas sp.]